jgi:hypothetical protein
MRIRIYYNKRKLKDRLTALLLGGGAFSMFYAASSFDNTGNIDSLWFAIGGLISFMIGLKYMYK